MIARHPIVLCLLALGLGTGAAQATSISPRPWRLLVEDAAFVGIVECEAAGGIVADFRVIESWKGLPAGSRLRISQALNVWEPTFPIALCGENYLVFADSSANGKGARLCSSFAVGCGQPLWWRRIPAPYATPMDYPPILLDEQGLPHAAWRLPGKAPTLQAFKDSVRRFLSLPASAREALNLRSFLGVSLPQAEGRARPGTLARPEMIDSMDVGWILSRVVEVVRSNPRERRFIGVRLGSVGGDEVIRFLRSDAGRETFGADSTREDHPLRYIKARRGEAPWSSDLPDSVPPAPVDSTRARLRSLLGGPSRDASTAFDILTIHDPAAVVEFLLSYQVPETTAFNRDTEYLHGCYFGWRCRSDRAKHFRRLLDARDPCIRVAAAVYLALEDSIAGTAALQRLCSLSNPAGGWAALALASHGDKSAVNRALQLFAEPVGPTVGDIYINNLKKRLLVLLSNSARASGVPPPPRLETACDGSSPFADPFARWWEEVEPRIRLHDPWGAMLAAQKVE